MKANQKGLSAVEVVLVLVIVGLVGVAGVMVFKNNTKKPAAHAVANASTKSATLAGRRLLQM